LTIDRRIREVRLRGVGKGGDGFVATALSLGTVVYLTRFPHNLGAADEGIFLYEAKRVLDGEVFYRDIFDIITPASHYVMAAAFRLFGTEFSTAQVVAAIVHGAIVALVYLACRTLNVRRPVALAAALAHLALCQSAWVYASPHWFSTALASLLLLLALRPDGTASRRGGFWLGAIVGWMIMVQQQKGVIFLPAVIVLLALRAVLERRFHPAHGGDWRSLNGRIAYLALGVAAVAVPSFLFLIARAGFGPVFYALVEHPMSNYHTINVVRSWGGVNFLSMPHAELTAPRFLAWLPAFLTPTLFRAARNWLRRERFEETASLSTLLVVSLFSAVSIAYNPDFIHIAFIAPIFFVAMAESTEWAMRKLLSPSRWLSPVGATVVGLILVGLCSWMTRNLIRAMDTYPINRDTAFGRVSFANDMVIELIDDIDEILADAPSREMFSYPYFPALYLLSGTKNPTPYQILLPPYSQPEQIRETIDILDSRRVHLIFVFPLFVKKDDPFVEYMREKYSQSKQHKLLWIRRPEPA